jgi:hypothetical protein
MKSDITEYLMFMWMICTREEVEIYLNVKLSKLYTFMYSDVRIKANILHIH